MATTIAQRELRNDNARVIEAVACGETFVITRHGVPVAELRPIPNGSRRVVLRKDLAEFVNSAARLDWKRFRSDIDAVIDQDL